VRWGSLLKASQGRARRINLLADKSLLAAYAEGARQVEKRHVKAACGELHADPASVASAGLHDWRHGQPDSGLAVPIALVAVLMLGWLRGTPIVPAEALASKMPVRGGCRGVQETDCSCSPCQTISGEVAGLQRGTSGTSRHIRCKLRRNFDPT
jgi:hypothetical protein